jgi:hypothetical protein
MGRRQFHASSPDWTQHHSHNGACAVGPLGKLLYAIQHAGAMYNSLHLNEDGKRSRKAPRVRSQCNRKAAPVAQGIPSNFTAEVVFADTASKRAGKGAFEAWVKAERELLRQGDRCHRREAQAALPRLIAGPAARFGRGGSK